MLQRTLLEIECCEACLNTDDLFVSTQVRSNDIAMAMLYGVKLCFVLLNYFLHCTTRAVNYYLDWISIPDSVRLVHSAESDAVHSSYRFKISQWTTSEIFQSKGNEEEIRILISLHKPLGSPLRKYRKKLDVIIRNVALFSHSVPPVDERMHYRQWSPLADAKKQWS
mmetsp:Transcript_14219/g.29412  ORF Transcript_14219/g.29412 Transcript_14219/m.29412 type:complete len:167 (-) Transcript_14219:490-990(-)